MKAKLTTYICEVSVLIISLFVSNAGWEALSNFTVIRGIGGVENDNDCDGSV